MENKQKKDYSFDANAFRADTTASTFTIEDEKSKKEFLPTLLLCLLVGSLGAHRFYTGKVVTAILMLLTFGGFGLWVIIDLIFIATGNFKDGQGLRISNK